MNGALVRKTFRDSWWLLILVPVAIVVFETLVVRAYREIGSEAAGFWMNRPCTRQLMRVLMGADLGASITPTVLVMIGFAHPLLHALNWLLLLTVCTRTTVGEIDRGTADVLLTLPISRASIYASVSSVWILVGVPVSLAPVLGVWIGEWLSPLWAPITFRPLFVLALNLLALYLSVGGVAMCMSSLVSRRGTAVALVLTGLLASVLLNFLASVWAAAERLAFLGLLHYYKPFTAIRGGPLPVDDLATLGAVAVVAWLSGLVCYCRRDIPAA